MSKNADLSHESDSGVMEGDWIWNCIELGSNHSPSQTRDR